MFLFSSEYQGSQNLLFDTVLGYFWCYLQHAKATWKNIESYLNVIVREGLKGSRDQDLFPLGHQIKSQLALY